MFFQFKIFLYSLIFLAIMEVLSADSVGSGLEFLSVNGFWLAFLIILALIGYFYQIAKRVSGKSIMTPMPIIFAFSSMGLLYFVQSEKQEHLLIGLATVSYYFIHIGLCRLKSCEKDKTAFGILAAGTLATIFLFYADSFGIYLNFAISLWILMTALMFVTSIVSYQYFWLINEDKKNVLNYSLVLGFIMSEIVWTANFWPFGYLTTGAISLIFYYVLWDLVQSYFRDQLSKKKVVINLLIFGFMVAIVLSSTRWLPVV